MQTLQIKERNGYAKVRYTAIPVIRNQSKTVTIENSFHSKRLAAKKK